MKYTLGFKYSDGDNGYYDNEDLSIQEQILVAQLLNCWKPEDGWGNMTEVSIILTGNTGFSNK